MNPIDPEFKHHGDNFWKRLESERNQSNPAEVKFYPPPETAKGGYMTTYTGTRLYPENPTPEAINIYDIAHATSLACRWGGHISEFHSVAQHCYNVSFFGENATECLIGLLHDASECYLGDMIRPLKYIPAMAAVYKPIEYRVSEAIASACGMVSIEKTPNIDRGDNVVLAREAAMLRPDFPQFAQDILVKIGEANLPFKEKWENWSPKKAKEMFLDRYFFLQAKRRNG